MAAPKLTPAQREQLLEWLAAEYSGGVIRRWFADRGWPAITDRTLSHYRHRFAALITEQRAARREGALTRGLALVEERVARLAVHADALEEIKWVADKQGRYRNEKAWRETLADIASELGHRVQKQELTGRNGGPIEHSHVAVYLPDNGRGDSSAGGAAGSLPE